MKRNYLFILSFLVGLFFLTTTAAYATESIVFVDDDPVNSDATVTYVGNWTESTFFPQTYGQGYHFTRDQGSVTMRANLDIDETGGGVSGTSGSQFQAFARWSAGNNRCNSVRIDVLNATTNTVVTSETVNQTTQGLQFNWTPIGGRFTAVPNQLYAIRVNAPGVCVTTADGGMFVQQTYDSSDVFNLTRNSIVDEPGVEDVGGNQSVTLDSTATTDTTVRSISVSMPNSGYVVVNASGYFNEGSGTSTLRCSITTGVVIDFDALVFARLDSTSVQTDSWGATRTFFFNSAGTRTFRLVCDSFSGVGTVNDVHMNGIYLPTGY